MNKIWDENAIRAEFERLDRITGLNGASLPICFGNAQCTLGSFTSYRGRPVRFRFSRRFLSELNASELFDLLLASPLASLVIDGGRQTLCVVIDGLDECAQGERNALAEVLARYAPRLPSWLRILVTARDVSAVRGPLQGAFQMELRGSQAQNRQDIRQYFIEQLQESCGDDPAWPKALDTLVERSGGIFLYATLVANGIREGKVSIQESDKFPEGLSDAFYQWFGWFFPDDGEYKSVYRAPLGVLLAAPEALPVGELKRIFDWDENQVNDFLRRIEVLLKRGTNDFGDETISFSHQYLSQWLDSPDACRFRSSWSAAMERMGSRFYELFQVDHGSVTHYESVYVLPLLEKSGQTARQDELAVDRDLLWAVVHAGDCCKQSSGMAMRCYELARDMAEQAVQERGEPDDRHDLAVVYERLAKCLMRRAKLDQSSALYEKALPLFEQQAKERGTPDDRRDLADSYGHVALILSVRREKERALAFYRKQMQTYEELVDEFGTIDDRCALLVNYERMGAILERQGELDPALLVYEKAVALAEWVDQDWDTPETRHDLAASHGRSADVLKAMGRPDAALDRFKQQAAIFEQEGSARDLDGLHDVYEKMAGILRELKRDDEADRRFEKALAVLERLAAEYEKGLAVHGQPNDRQTLLYRLGTCYEKMAEDLASLGRYEEAAAQYGKSLTLEERRAREEDTPQSWRHLGYRCLSAGVTFRKYPGNAALAFFEKSLHIREKLVREQNEEQDRRDLGVTCYYISLMYKRQGEMDEAESWRRRYRSLCGRPEEGAVDGSEHGTKTVKSSRFAASMNSPEARERGAQAFRSALQKALEDAKPQ